MATTVEGAAEDAHDLLWGAGPIARELFGRDDLSAQRKAYHQLEKGYIPARKVGAIWCASRSAIRRHLAGEAASA